MYFQFQKHAPIFFVEYRHLLFTGQVLAWGRPGQAGPSTGGDPGRGGQRANQNQSAHQFGPPVEARYDKIHNYTVRL